MATPLSEQLVRVRAAHDALRGAMAALDPHLAPGDDTPSSEHSELNLQWIRFRRDFEEHMTAEDDQVLPALAALSEGREPEVEAFEAHLLAMGAELEVVRAVAASLADVADQAGEHEGALRGLLTQLEEHARREEQDLYPAAMALLDTWQKSVDIPEDEGWKTPDEVIRRTQGVCHTCSAMVPAQVVRNGNVASLEKHCPEHGVSVQILSRAADYYADLDRFYFQVNAEEYDQRDFIVRMTENCNLDCPICLAKANTEDTPDLDLSGLENLLSERRGIKVDLMAAEPTLRDDLEDWIRKVKATGNIAALHTNGLKLANRAYAERIKASGVDEVFVQFDGFDEEAHMVLRGRPLIKARMAAMKNLRDLNIATSLIVVIARGLNEAEVSKTFRFALEPENEHIREVFFLGLRVLGSARDALKRDDTSLFDMAMMPDELIDLLCAQEDRIEREHIRLFNRVYFSLLSAFKVKKCLYVQHYMVDRDGRGDMRPISDLLDLKALGKASDRYASSLKRHPRAARARFIAALARQGVNQQTVRILLDLVRLQQLFRTGMNLKQVPRRFLLLGFITACDPHNFDAQVSINCGKGELSVDGGFVDSGAQANVDRERRFDETDLTPGELNRQATAERKERLKSSD